MRRRGRPPAWTKEQSERVLALAAEGTSQRQIAEEVFGETRYRGRVERILGALPRRSIPVEAVPAPYEDVGSDARLAHDPDMPDMASFLAELVVRQWRELAGSGVLPPLGDLEHELETRGFKPAREPDR